MIKAEHSAARVSRFLIVITTTAEPPRINRDSVGGSADVILGDGVTAVPWCQMEAALFAARHRADSREIADSFGEPLWVWLGHDQFFYRTEWQFYHCIGPEWWMLPSMAASFASQQAAVDRVAAKKAAEAEANRKEAERNKLLRQAGQKVKKTRGGDAIADGGK